MSLCKPGCESLMHHNGKVVCLFDGRPCPDYERKQQMKKERMDKIIEIAASVGVMLCLAGIVFLCMLVSGYHWE